MDSGDGVRLHRGGDGRVGRLARSPRTSQALYPRRLVYTMGGRRRAPRNRDRGAAQWAALRRLVRAIAARGNWRRRGRREFDGDREEIPRSGAKAVGRQRLFIAKIFYSKDSRGPTTAASSTAMPRFQPGIPATLHTRGCGGRG